WSSSKSRPLQCDRLVSLSRSSSPLPTAPAIYPPPRCWKSGDSFTSSVDRAVVSIPETCYILCFLSRFTVREDVCFGLVGRLDLFQKTNESLKPPAQVHLMTFCSKFEHVLAGVNSGSFAPDHPLTGEEKRRMKWSGCLWDLLQPEIIKPTGEPHMPEHGSLSPPTIKTTGLHWLVSSMERDTIGAVSTAPE
ncbi:unnamed protein product, partial [Musa textilis]